MIKCVFYFAYGANMNPIRMRNFAPNARRVGVGYVAGYEVRERLYANLEPKAGNRVDGVVYLMTESEVDALDRFMGYPSKRASKRVKVCLRDGIDLGGDMNVPCITYVMTPSTRDRQLFKRYPEQYRKECSLGARINGIKDIFATEREKQIREEYMKAVS